MLLKYYTIRILCPTLYMCRTCEKSMWRVKTACDVWEQHVTWEQHATCEYSVWRVRTTCDVWEQSMGSRHRSRCINVCILSTCRNGSVCLLAAYLSSMCCILISVTLTRSTHPHAPSLTRTLTHTHPPLPSSIFTLIRAHLSSVPYALRGRGDDFSFFDCSSPFCFLLIEFHYLVSFLLFQCVSVWENTLAWVPHFL